MVCPFLALLLITSVNALKAYAYVEECRKFPKPALESNDELVYNCLHRIEHEFSEEKHGWDRRAWELKAYKTGKEPLKEEKKWWEKLESCKLKRYKRAASFENEKESDSQKNDDIFSESDEMVEPNDDKTKEEVEEDENKEQLEIIKRMIEKKEFKGDKKITSGSNKIWSNQEEPYFHQPEADQFHNKWSNQKNTWPSGHQYDEIEGEENEPYDPLGIWTKEELKEALLPPVRPEIRKEDRYAYKNREQKQKEREEEMKRKEGLIQRFRDRLKEVQEKQKRRPKEPKENERTTLNPEMLEEIKDRNETIEMLRDKLREYWRKTGLRGTESSMFKAKSYVMRDYWHTEKDVSTTKSESFERREERVKQLWEFI